ncbi:MAG TPA: calcium-binding protein [Acetobacteraceae bacterium]|nr:calcium-binding protein [Acetobacteraceae bacterium]
MPIVTVPGANHSTVKLSYDLDANAVLARYIAGVIKTGLAGGTIDAFDNKSGSPPSLPPGVTGEFVQSHSGSTMLPKGYDFVVDSAKSAQIFGNGDDNEAVLVGKGNLQFFAMGGSGSVIGGGGNDMFESTSSDNGNWLIALGNGNDSIRAFGGGNDTISTGSGHSILQLGSGSDYITTTGSDTVLAGSGSETINAIGAHDVVYGNASSLLFVAGGAATIFGGSGSDTVLGSATSKGADLFEGGSAGNNFLQAGNGPATLFGGGDGDQLYAGGGGPQQLHAAGGNETLFGGFGSGSDTFYGGSGADQITGGTGTNTFVAGTGTATITASPGSMNVFDFMKTMGGGSETVTGLTDQSQVHIDLSGYGKNEVKYALAHQTTANGSVTVTLSDNTTVTFQNIASLSGSNFTDSNSSGGGSGGKGGFGDKHGFGHDQWGDGDHNWDDHSHHGH